MKDVVVIIPSKRPPPIKTLEEGTLVGATRVVVLADPSVYGLHSRYHGGEADVMLGGSCVGEQIWMAYRLAHKLGYKYWFKADDDLPKNTFYAAKGFAGREKPGYISFCDAVSESVACAESLGVSHAGFANTTAWLKNGYSRSKCVIHGGGNIARSCESPFMFIDRRLRRSGDVYRSCAHIQSDGHVGVIRHVGFNKQGSTASTTMPLDQASVESTKRLILERFSGVAEYVGGGLADWRILR